MTNNRLLGAAILATFIALDVCAESYVRPSTTAESKFRQGHADQFGSVPYDFLDGTVVRQGKWEHEGFLWQTGFIPTAHSVFAPGDEITIVSSLFDYSRTSLAIDLHLSGSQLLLDGQGLTSNIQPAIFMFPEDISKELVFPVGSLAPGTYELAITNYVDVLPVDLGCIRSFDDPSCLELPEPNNIFFEETLTFTVLPEPQNVPLFLWAVVLLLCGPWRAPRQV